MLRLDDPLLEYRLRRWALANQGSGVPGMVRSVMPDNVMRVRRRVPRYVCQACWTVYRANPKAGRCGCGVQVTPVVRETAAGVATRSRKGPDRIAWDDDVVATSVAMAEVQRRFKGRPPPIVELLLLDILSTDLDHTIDDNARLLNTSPATYKTRRKRAYLYLADLLADAPAPDGWAEWKTQPFDTKPKTA